MKQRANSISLLRLITCLSIFIYHYLTNFTIFKEAYFPSTLLTFIFAFLSGFLYGPKEIKDSKSWLKQNVKKIAIPTFIYAIIFSLIIFTTGLIKYSGDIAQTMNGFIGKNIYTGSINFVFGNLWFVGILLIAYLFTPIIYKITRKQYKLKTTIILISLIVIISVCEILFNFFAPIFTIYILAYLIGFKYFNRITYEKEDRWYIYLIMTIICALGFTFWYTYIMANYSNEYFNFKIKILIDITEAINAISFSILFIRAFKFLNSFNIKIFKYTDKYSFPFYMTHQAFMTGVLCFFSIINPSWLYLLICFILAATSSIFIQFISDKIFIKINNKTKSNKS